MFEVRETRVFGALRWEVRRRESEFVSWQVCLCLREEDAVRICDALMADLGVLV